MRGRSIILFGVPSVDEAVTPPEYSAVRVTQMVLEVLGYETVVETPTEPPGGGTIPPGTNPTQAESICGATVPIPWIEITPADSAVTRRYSGVPINIDGYPKEPRLLEAGVIERKLSDVDGNFQGVSISLTLDDTDRYLRDLEETDSLINARVAFYISPEATIRAAGDPRHVFDGIVSDTEPLGGLKFRLQISDFLSSLLEQFAANIKLPRRTFNTVDFPNIGNSSDDESTPGNPSVIGKPVPIGYGLLSDESLLAGALTTNPVTLDPTQGYGGLTTESYYPLFGWGTVGVTGPSNCTLGEASGGAFMAADTVYVMVTAVVGGVESNPYPMNGAGTSHTFVGNNQKLTLSTGAVGGATAYRWYVRGNAIWGHTATPRTFAIFRETPGTSTELTNGGNENVGPWPPPDTNWSGIPYGGPRWAIVQAKIGSSLSPVQSGPPQYPGYLMTGPWRSRPVRIAWQAYPSAEEYWVYVTGGSALSGYGYKYVVTAPTTYLDWTPDLAYIPTSGPYSIVQGVVPATFVGRRYLSGFWWDEYVLFGHAPSPGGVVSIFGDYGPGGVGVRSKYTSDMYGVNVIAPGHEPSWSATVGSAALYRDYNGHRYCSFFARGPASDSARTGKVPFTVNIGGVEDNGDGTGTMISSIHFQFYHLLVNFIIKSYETGAWFACPAIGGTTYSMIDSTTISDTWTASTSYVTGGFKGAFLLGIEGGQISPTDALRQLAINGGFNYGFNEHGQIIVSMIELAKTLNRHVYDVNDTIEDTFTARRRRDQLRNSIKYRYGKRYTSDKTNPTPAEGDPLPAENVIGTTPEWLMDNVIIFDTPSINKYGTREEDLSFEMVRDSETADAVAKLRLRTLQHGPLIDRFTERLCGCDTDLGDRDYLDHFELPSTGDTNRSIRCESHKLDLDELTVEKEYRDLTNLDFSGV